MSEPIRQVTVTWFSEQAEPTVVMSGSWTMVHVNCLAGIISRAFRRYVDGQRVKQEPTKEK